jgi:hypothetical protein
VFDEEPSHFNALLTGVLIGVFGTLFWVALVWASR